MGGIRIMAEIVIVADHKHACVNSHNSIGYVQLLDDQRILFDSLSFEDDEQLVAQTPNNGFITFPVKNVWSIHYGSKDA
jgi:hypothetical protein